MYRLGALTHLDTTTGITSITGVMLPSTQPVSQLSGFTFARASLEGMPADLRLEIMLHLPDLSTLRLLKLASREYYFTARACEHSLAAVHRFHTCHYIRNDPRLKWLRSMEETLFTASKEWYTDINPSGGHDSIWMMPGTRSFVFNKSAYIVSRMYRLRGTYPGYETAHYTTFHDEEEYYHMGLSHMNRVSSHSKDLKARFELRRSRLKLSPRDRQYADNVRFLYSTDFEKYSSRAEQDVEFWRLFDASVEAKRQKDLLDSVGAAMRRHPQLAVKCAEMLHEAGALQLQDGEWKLVYTVEDEREINAFHAMFNDDVGEEVSNSENWSELADVGARNDPVNRLE